MKVNFTIHSEPIAKARPRMNTITGKAYTPSKTRIFEDFIAISYGNRYYFDDEYIRVRLKFKFKVPKSYSKKKYQEAIEGKIRPTKGDTDNYTKAVLDGLNGKAFKDDRYIYAIDAEKIYAEEPGIEVTIESI